MTLPARLPQGWQFLGPAATSAFRAELPRELTPEHPLYAREVEAIAVRGGKDDALFRSVSEASRVTVVHLTWTGRAETNPHFPAVVFDGTLADFMFAEERGET